MKIKGSKRVGASYEEGEDEIPIITDAVVIIDEEGQHTSPPARNPEYTPGVQTSVVPVDGQNNVVVQKPPAVLSSPLHINMGRTSTGLVCPHCGRQTITITQDVIGAGTILAVFILALLFWPLCWVPFCMPVCHRTNHFCGHETCRKRVGETGVCA